VPAILVMASNTRLRSAIMITAALTYRQLRVAFGTKVSNTIILAKLISTNSFPDD
jgi:hypothetical protein